MNVNISLKPRLFYQNNMTQWPFCLYPLLTEVYRVFLNRICYFLGGKSIDYLIRTIKYDGTVLFSTLFNGSQL